MFVSIINSVTLFFILLLYIKWFLDYTNTSVHMWRNIISTTYDDWVFSDCFSWWLLWLPALLISLRRQADQIILVQLLMSLALELSLGPIQPDLLVMILFMLRLFLRPALTLTISRPPVMAWAFQPVLQSMVSWYQLCVWVQQTDEAIALLMLILICSKTAALSVPIEQPREQHGRFQWRQLLMVARATCEEQHGHQPTSMLATLEYLFL